jgi:probable HAF family extracellular repeat protein
MKRFLYSWVLLSLLVGVAGSQEYTVTDLGTLPGPRFTNSRAVGISASGQVVGGALQAQGKLAYYYAFLWQNGQMSDCCSPSARLA